MSGAGRLTRLAALIDGCVPTELRAVCLARWRRRAGRFSAVLTAQCLAKFPRLCMASPSGEQSTVPEVRAAAKVTDEALWFHASKSGSVPTWGFAVDLRGGSHTAEHGSGLGTFFESQFGWDVEEGDLSCIETRFKLHDASGAQAQPIAVPVPPVQWRARGGSVRPHAPLEIGVSDLEVAAVPQSEKTAARITQAALETQAAASAAAALRRLQLRALPTTFPYLRLRTSPASLFGCPALSIQHERKLNAEPEFIQQLEVQIQRRVFLLLSSAGMKQFLLEELIVLHAQTKVEVIAESASLRPLHRRYLFSVDVGFQHDGVPQQVNLFVDNWQYFAWPDVPQLSAIEFRRHEHARARATAERMVRQTQQVNGDPQVPHLLATCILLIAPSAPSLTALSSALLELLFKHIERVCGKPLAMSAATVFAQLDTHKAGSITALRLAEYVQGRGAVFTVADLRRLASTPFEGPLVRVADVGAERFYSFNPLTVTLRSYARQPTSDADRRAPDSEHSLTEYTVTKVTEQVFSLSPDGEHSSNSNHSTLPTFTFICPDRPASQWIAVVASALAEYTKQRAQEGIAKAVLSATEEIVYGLY